MGEPTRVQSQFIFYEDEVPSEKGRQLLKDYRDDPDSEVEVRNLSPDPDRRRRWKFEGWVSKDLFREISKLAQKK